MATSDVRATGGRGRGFDSARALVLSAVTVAEGSSSGRFWREMRLLVVAALAGFAAMILVAIGYGVANARHEAQVQADFKNAASVELVVVSSVFYSVIAAFILWRISPTTGVSLNDLGLRGLRGRDWGTIGLGLVAILAANLLYQRVMAATGNAQHLQAGFEHVRIQSTAAGVFFVVSSAVIAPFAEELLFRMILFRTLAQKMPWLLAAIISAIVFGLGHGDIVAFPVLAWLGFVNAVAYQRTGNILTSMVLHGANNLWASAALLFLR